MSNRCPKCRTPNLLHTSDASEAARLETCPRCATTWFARIDKDGPHIKTLAIGGQPATRLRPVVIDAVTTVESRFTVRILWQAAVSLARWIPERCLVGRVFPVTGDR